MNTETNDIDIELPLTHFILISPVLTQAVNIVNSTTIPTSNETVTRRD